jgi:uncharacterized protein (DUF1697 family)
VSTTEQPYVALLRGVNVGRHRRMRMADLRAALAEAGFGRVRTLLQSGNVVLDGAGDEDRVAAEVQRVIRDAFGFDVAVVVRTAQELADVIAANPLGREPADGARYFVAFLARQPEPGTAVVPELPPGSTEQWWARGREVYVWCPEGLLASPLMAHFAGGVPGVDATVRNWNTVTALARLTAG